ncbi:MAG: hypothetical protein U0531_09540 [Dehalococcoidia bacterium]
MQRALAAIDLPTGWTPIPGGGLCGPTLRRRLAGALDSAWQREPIGTGLSLSDLRRMIPDLNLPPDGVLGSPSGSAARRRRRTRLAVRDAHRSRRRGHRGGRGA